MNKYLPVVMCNYCLHAGCLLSTHNKAVFFVLKVFKILQGKYYVEYSAAVFLQPPEFPLVQRFLIYTMNIHTNMDFCP